MLVDIGITLKSHFWNEKDEILSFCMQRHFGRHYITLQNLNHKWSIHFNAWCFITPICDVMIKYHIDIRIL